MRCSNIYYIVRNTLDTKELEYVAVDGIAVKNSFGLDLFRHKSSAGHYVLSEGMTGYKICDINPSRKDDGDISSPKDVDGYLGAFNQRANLHKHEQIKQLTEKMADEGKLTPRYTEPDKKRPPKEKKEPNPNLVLRKSLYDEGKKYFIRVFNQDGIQLFKKKDSGDSVHFTVLLKARAGWFR